VMRLLFHPSSQETTMHKLHSSPLISGTGAVAKALAASMALVAEPAEARERQVNISGSDGHNAPRNEQRARGDVSSTATGTHGNTRSRAAAGG